MISQSVKQSIKHLVANTKNLKLKRKAHMYNNTYNNERIHVAKKFVVFRKKVKKYKIRYSLLLFGLPIDTLNFCSSQFIQKYVVKIKVKIIRIFIIHLICI